MVGLTCYYILLPEVPTRYILKLSDIILTLPNGNSSIYWALTPTSFCYFRKNLVWHGERNTFYVGVITTSIKLSLFSLYLLHKKILRVVYYTLDVYLGRYSIYFRPPRAPWGPLVYHCNPLKRYGKVDQLKTQFNFGQKIFYYPI